MHYKYFYFFSLLIIQLSILVYPQDKLPDSEKWIIIDKDLMYNIVIATDANQKINKGLLYGMKGDSIYLSVKNEMIRLNLRNLLTLSIEDRRTNNRGFVYGTIGGMYLGTLLFLTSQDQPAKYLEYEDTGVIALYELLFAAVGGGIGYLIDRSSGDQQEVFYFNRDGSGVEKEIKRLKDFLTNSSSSKKIKLNFHLSQVNTRYSEIQDISNNEYYWNGYYSFNYYYQTHNFNMLRKLSLTYDIFEKLEIGIALNWFGEPSFYYNKSDYTYDPVYTTSTISQDYDGLGYYLILNFKPLKNIISDNFDLLIGAGVGFGNIDYSFKSETITQNSESETIVVNNDSRIDDVLFSSIIMCEIKYFIYPELSLSLQTDYIYLPENMPAIPEFGIEETRLGNFSIGLGIGINY